MPVPDDVAAVFGPFSIHAPDGTRFTLRRLLDASTPEQAFDQARLQLEVTGPQADGSMVWLASHDGTFVEDESIPAQLTARAQLAVEGWLRWEGWLEQNG